VQISLQKIPTESIKWKANLKWPGLKLLLKKKIFTFENFSTWAGRPQELGPLKNLYVFPSP
jgi:hypothetical protein